MYSTYEPNDKYPTSYDTAITTYPPDSGEFDPDYAWEDRDNDD